MVESKGGTIMKHQLLLFGMLSVAPLMTPGQGTIIFSNQSIPTANGGRGSNLNGTYNVPIWTVNSDGRGLAGAGSLPGGVTIGLFLLNGSMIGSTPLRTDAGSYFFAN